MKYSVIVELFPISERVAKSQLKKIAEAISEAMPSSWLAMESELGLESHHLFQCLSRQCIFLDDACDWNDRAMYGKVAEIREEIGKFEAALERHLASLTEAQNNPGQSNEPSKNYEDLKRATNKWLLLARGWKGYLNEVPMPEALELEGETAEIQLDWKLNVIGPEEYVMDTLENFLRRADAARRENPRLCSFESKILPQNAATSALMLLLDIKSSLVDTFDISGHLLEPNGPPAPLQEDADSVGTTEFTIVVTGQESQVSKLVADFSPQPAL